MGANNLPDRSSVTGLIITALTALRSDLQLPVDSNPSPATPLLGSGTDLDSMALIHLVADIESALRQSFGRDWILADERAFSRQRSPFRTIGDLADFIMETIPE